jgi:hypothetical protein
MHRTPSDRPEPSAKQSGASDLERTPAALGRTVADHVAPAERAPRRVWTAPQLTTHESLTVLTQHFFGPAGVALALQINCGVSGKKFGC